jgi:hypothetical protein
VTARTNKRADSRAHAACPLCGRKQHGLRGLAAHVKNVHGADEGAPLSGGSAAVSPTRGEIEGARPTSPLVGEDSLRSRQERGIL